MLLLYHQDTDFILSLQTAQNQRYVELTSSPFLTRSLTLLFAFSGINWYLIGVIFVLSFYPRDVAVLSILSPSQLPILRVFPRLTSPSPCSPLLGRHRRLHLRPPILFLPIQPSSSSSDMLWPHPLLVVEVPRWVHRRLDDGVRRGRWLLRRRTWRRSE
jgi:hypothetical protein